MTTKLTAEEAWDRSPPCLTTTNLYCDLHVDDQGRVSRWFADVESSISREKDAEVERLNKIIEDLREDNMHYANEPKPTVIEHIALKAECHSLKGEIAQLKSRIAELERHATPSPPKPRKTAGEKLSDLIARHTGCYYRWCHRSDRNKSQLQAAALELGLTDDPEPPSDGELLCEAYNAKVMLPLMEADFWMHTAVEFLAKRAERDGGAT